MKFQFMKLKNGKFFSYGYCVVPSYDAYVVYVERMNREKARNGFSFVTC